jgi:hypothetical protein
MGFIPAGTAFGALAFACGFLWMAVALGDRLLRWLRIPMSAFSALEKGLIAAAIGAGCVQYVPFALAAIGRLSVSTVRWSLALIALALIPDLVRIARAVVAELRGLRARSLSAPSAAWLLTLAVFLLLLLTRALNVSGTGDDDGYHLLAPKRWLAAGTLEYLPTYSHTNSAMGFEMLYLCGLAVGGVTAAKLLHFTAGCCSLLGLFLTGRRLAGVPAGLGAASLLMLPTPLYSVPVLFGLAYCDLAVCWMTVTAVLCWSGWHSSQRDRLLVPAALCAGFAGSFKFTALFVGAAFIPVLVMNLRHRGGAWRDGAARVVGFSAISVAPVFPWLWRNFRLTGNPVYPMLSGLIPTRDWSPENARIFGIFFRYYTWAVAAGSRLSLSDRKLILAAALLVLLLCFAVALRLTKRAVPRSLLVFGTGLLLAQVALTGLSSRFWLPGIMCLGLFLVTVVAGPRPRSQRLSWAAVALLMSGTALHGAKAYKAGLGRDFNHAIGLSSLEERNHADLFWRLSRFLDTNTPEGSHILMASMFETFGVTNGDAFWIDRPCYVTDSHLQGFIKLDDWPSFLDSVRRARIDFVVISDRLFNAGRHGFSFVAGRNEYPFTRRLANEYGARLYQLEHLQIYRLRPIGATDDSPRAPATPTGI